MNCVCKFLVICTLRDFVVMKFLVHVTFQEKYVIGISPTWVITPCCHRLATGESSLA
jgi:hypothetical protein